jgi:hypothetical protein
MGRLADCLVLGTGHGSQLADHLHRLNEHEFHLVFLTDHSCCEISKPRVAYLLRF